MINKCEGAHLMLVRYIGKKDTICGYGERYNRKSQDIKRMR